jgi:hypothetical protein
VGQALRPYPQYSGVTKNDAKLGVARYNSLQIKLTRRYSKGLTTMGSFTWSKNLTNMGGTMQTPLERNKIVAPSATTAPAEFKVSATYDLPFGKGKSFLKNGGRVVNGVVGGWQVVFFIQRASGSALSITPSNTLNTYGLGKRANVNLGVPMTVNTSMGSFNPATDKYINPAAFSDPATFALGNAPAAMDWLRGWGVHNESASINKNFHLYERMTMKLSADFQNPFNLVRWNNPVTTLSASNFGMVTGSAPGRRVQLNLNIEF